MQKGDRKEMIETGRKRGSTTGRNGQKKKKIEKIVKKICVY